MGYWLNLYSKKNIKSEKNTIFSKKNWYNMSYQIHNFHMDDKGVNQRWLAPFSLPGFQTGAYTTDATRKRGE